MPKRAAIHEDLGRRHRVRGSSERSFGLVFAGAFVVVGLVPLAHGGTLRLWGLGIAVAFLIVALASPRLLAPLNRAWVRVGLVLNRATSPVILGLVFFVALAPLAACLRLLGKGGFTARPGAAQASYWIERRPPGPEPRSMQRMF